MIVQTAQNWQNNSADWISYQAHLMVALFPIWWIIVEIVWKNNNSFTLV